MFEILKDDDNELLILSPVSASSPDNQEKGALKTMYMESRQPEP